MKRHPPHPIPALALIAALTLSLAAPAFAQRNDTVTGDRGSDMAVDLVLVRPLGIVATVVGAAGFLLALPFTLPSGSAGETAREWVTEPFEYTFNRPLGSFSQCGADRHPCGSD